MTSGNPYMVAKVEASGFAAEARELFKGYVKEYAETGSQDALRSGQHNWSQHLFWTEAAKVLYELAYDVEAAR